MIAFRGASKAVFLIGTTYFSFFCVNCVCKGVFIALLLSTRIYRSTTAEKFGLTKKNICVIIIIDLVEKMVLSTDFPKIKRQLPLVALEIGSKNFTCQSKRI